MKQWTRQGLLIVRAAIGAALIFAAIGDTRALAQPPHASDKLVGRWDLVITRGSETFPAWLEVDRSGMTRMVGRFVGFEGSARPIAKVVFTDGTFKFAVPPQWESSDNDINFDGRVDGDKVTGSVTMGDGQKGTWTGTRAPSLRRSAPPAWGSPIALFDGKGLDAWKPIMGSREQGQGGGPESQWSVAGGILKNAKKGTNLVSVQKFDDFKLHLEFRVPKGENSGVYLRGRYELQVDDAAGHEPTWHNLGAVYGYIAPSENAAKPAGEWQTMDITLIGRRLTYVLNGKTIICDQEIPGITGGALDSAEGEPGPLLLQGDHGPMEYRNIVVTPAKSAR